MLNTILFQDQALFDAVIPGLSAKMGNLDIDLYTGTLDIKYTVTAALNCWGNFYVPKNLMDIAGGFLLYDNYFPSVISFQGKLDKVAFPNKEGLYYPPMADTLYRTESGCVLTNGGTFTLPAGQKNKTSIVACGAEALRDILNDSRINIPNELYEDCSMAYGLDGNPHCTIPGC